jgi:hypothetical protein
VILAKSRVRAMGEKDADGLDVPPTGGRAQWSAFGAEACALGVGRRAGLQQSVRHVGRTLDAGLVQRGGALGAGPRRVRAGPQQAVDVPNRSAQGRRDQARREFLLPSSVHGRRD